MFTRTDRRRFPILLAVLAALALAMPMLFSTVQAQEGSAPDQPRGLDATATHGQVVLTWDAPEDESITGYVVLRRVPAVDPEGQFRELVSDTGTDATTYTDDTVSAETRYTYRIKAINEHGVSERSRWVHINVPAAPEAAEGDDQDGEGDDGAPGKRANVSEGGTDCPVNTTTTCEVDVGGSATGEISSGTDQDWFKVVLEADTRYQIDLEGKDTGRGTLDDPRLLGISNSAGVAIADTGNLDSGVGENSRVIFEPNASGTFYISAWLQTGEVRRTYTLSVIVLGANGASEADTDFPATTATTGRVEVGASATGNIRNNSDQDWFRVDLEADKQYQFDQEGAPTGRGTLTDPRLALFSGSGISLAINDDISSTNLNSRIVRTATETGAHYLRAARSFGNTGTYTLSVHDITPPPSTDATLSALSVTGGGSELITDFASGTTNYPLSVANGVDEVTFAPTTNHAGATVQYLGRGAVTLTDADDMEDGFQVALDVGLNLLTLYVLAEDGTTIRVYYVNVTRAAACTLNDGDLWCGVVTVGEIVASGNTYAHGFIDVTGLSAGTFAGETDIPVGSNTYTFVGLYVPVTGSFDGRVTLRANDNFTTAEQATLELHIDVDGTANTLVMSGFEDSTNGQMIAPRTDSDWSSATTVTARLRPLTQGPTVTNVEVTSTPVLETDTYGAGETIEVSVTFSEAVNATSDTDFVLSVAGVRRAPLLRGSGTATLVFGYTVVSSDEDTNGIWIGDETRTLVGNRNGEPQNGTITSVATGAAADLDHTELGTDSDHKVDGSRTTDNVAPSFTSLATFDAAENQTAAGTVVAADSDADDSVTGYAITGGADMALFEIGATSGELTFKSAPNFEDPQDSGTDNVHEVTVQATSGAGTREKTATQTITVTVTNVDEGQSGTVTIDDTAPMVGDELTASAANVADPDGLPDPFAPDWQWYRTPDGGSETAIPGAASATYTVVEADLGAMLTAKATWTDKGSFANTLSSAPTGAVAAASALPTLSVANGSATEGSLIRFPLTLSAAPGEIVSVQCIASFETGDTAAAADLASDNSTATIQMGSTSGSCAISSAQDTIDEENETFTVTLSNPSSNAQLATDPTAKGTINDNDDPPTLSVGDLSADEGDTSISTWSFTVTLSTASGKTVTVDYATSVETGDTATAGTDFVVDNGTLTFNPGVVTRQFHVIVDGDTTVEDDETFTVTLSNPSNATISDATAKGTIENDDEATLDVLVSNYPDGSGSDFSLNFVQSGNSQRHYIAQTFTADAGFTLTAVDIPFRRVPDNSRVTVSLHALNGSKPGTYLAGLDLSGALAVGDNTFAAPAGTALAAGSYFVRVRWRSGDTNNLLMTDGPDDETSAESGWSIEDRSHYSASGSSWSNWNQQFAMRVRGTIDGVPRVATGGVRIESDPDAHDSYGVGEEIKLAVGFTDDVTVDTMSGTPRVELTVGSNTRYADYSASDSSADELAFLYEVTADDHDQDGVSIDADALELNGGAIHKDGDTSTNAVLGHAALDADSDHRVNRDPFIVSDGVSVISDPQALADTYGLGEVIEIEVEFSAAVDAATGTDFVLSVSGPKRAPLLRGSGTKKLVFGYTVVASDDDDSGIWIGEQDRTLVGNRNGDPQNGEITSAVTDRAADLDHDSPGVLSGHKVDGSRTTGNVAPSFTSSAAFDAAENQTAAGTVLAADSDADDSVTGYAITGGADQTFFSIGATSGVLTFDAAPNYEDAQDQGNNNTYVVDVTATSGMDTRVMTATQTITVTVTDVDTEAPGQPGAPAVSAASAASATSLRVNWSAPSNAGPAITDYDVQYRAGNSGSWSDGGHIGTATTATLTGLSEDTSYQVQVRATNDEGTGAWSDAGSGSTDAPPDNCTGDTTTTCEVDVGGSATGNIGSDREQDWFKVELEAGKRYQFDVEGADTSRGNLADPYLWGGYDSTGSSVSGLRSNDGGVGKNGRDTYTPTAAGTYYIAVADATFVGRGTYTLSVIVLGANGNSEANTDCPATTATTCRVDVGASATGNIGSNDIDWFRVDLETGKKYQFDLEGADTGRGTLGDPNLSLFDGSGIYIGVDDDSGTGLNSQIVYTATETGAHYLRATRTLTGTGTYTLSVRDVTPPPDDCTDNTATTCEVDVGGSAMGNIDSETDVDWFRIDLVSDTRYQFDLEGDDTTRGNLGDPYLQLANSLGNVLGGTQNRDSGVGDNARVIWTPANIGNELVYLIVEGAANTTGTYTLSVIVLGANGNSEADTDCPTGTTTTCQVEVGASATGNVSTDIDGDWFKAVLEADKTYQIDLEGTAGGGGTLPDPELYNIRDSSGDAIADTNNDDVGGEDGILDSRVIFTPTTAGTYYLEASSATGEHGTYTLSVREVAPPDDLPVDDCPRNTTTTCEVEVGGSVMGTIGNDLDTDWFRVELKAGRTYRIDMKGAILVAPGTLLDRELTLRLPQINTIRGRNGGQLVNTFGRDESSAHHLFRVTFHAHDDGAHYIAASGESFEKGGYKLRVIDITRDDDATPVAVTVQFGAASYTATEGGTAATVTVNLSADPGRSVTIPVTAAGADGAGSGDYTLSDTSVTIDSGETSATFIVTATDDSVDDDGESVNLSFGTLPDAVSRGALATASVSLVDDDGADTTAPTVDSATVSQDGTSIDVVFDEDLDATGSEPAASAFGVTVDGGTAVNPASVAISDDTVTLTMASADAIAAGAAVTVAYDKPTTNPLKDAADNEVADFTQTAANRPAAPVVTLTAGNEKLTAAWTAPANGGNAITGYDVEWKTAAQTWAEAATAGQSATAAADATGHEITGLTNDTEYTVRVRAKNAAGDGPWSAEASETPNRPAAPGKPQNIQIVFEKTTNGYDAKLSWDAPDDLGGGTFQSYSWILTKSVEGGNLVIESDDMQETAPAADSPIRERLPSPEIGDVYRLAVTVWTEAASASAARSAIFVLGETGAPEVTQAAMRSDGLLLAWSAPEIASSLDVTGYQARYKLTGAADVDDSWTTVAAGATSPYTITGLADSAGYNVRMRAVIEWNSGAYYGDWSEAKHADNPWIVAGGVDVTSLPESKLGGVTFYGRGETLEFTVEFNEEVTVTGEPEFEFCLGAVDASCTEGEDPPARRRAAYNSGDSTDKLVFSYVVGLDATDLDTDGIRIDDSAIRLGADENIVSADTETAAHLGHAAPGIQTGHRVDDSDEADTTAPSVSSAKVSEDGMTILIVFDQELDSNSTVAVGEFAVTEGAALPRKPSGAALSGADTVTLTMTPAIAGGETVSVAYTAPATGGLQDASNNKVAGFTESVINRPAKPTGLTLTAGHEKLTASWTAPTATGGSAITGYDVEWKTAAQTWAEAATAGQSATAAADATTHEITGLTNDTEYTVRVRAKNAAGDGPWSAEESETPAVPANKNADLADLSIEGVTVAGFDKDTLSYEVVVVLPRASLVTIETSTVNDQARVRYSPVGTDASVASPGFQVSLLHKTPTTYTITVTSADGSVTKAYAIEITRYTLPGAPRRLDARASHRQVDLSWNDPDNSDIESYQYRVSGDGGNTWDPDWTEIDGSDASTTGLTLTDLDDLTAYTFEVRAVVQGTAGAAASDTATTLSEAASNNADLADLSVEGVTVASFDKDTLSYEVVVVLPSAGLVTIETSTAIAEARVGYSPVATDADTTSPGHQVTVPIKTPTTYTITVTSASGSVTKEYTIEITRYTLPGAPGGLDAQASYRQVNLSWNDPSNSDIESYQYRVSGDGGNTWDPDWTEIEDSDNLTNGLTLTDLDHGTEYTFEVRAVVQGSAGAATPVTATPAATTVAHDWALRPQGIATGETFRLLIVTSDRRNGESGNVDNYNNHVQDAVASGHSAIQDYSSDFRALVGTRGGASPRDNTHSNEDSDGNGEQIWWLKGPRAADNYADFYDGSWDHTNPVRLESGNSYTFLEQVSGASDPHRRAVWTGARANGTRASNRHMGSDNGAAYVGAPYYKGSPLQHENWAWTLNARIRLYGLSPVFLVEVPDAPYATTAAITTDPANGTEYQTGEVVKATVTFSEDVTVMGTPQLPLRIGGEERNADYAAGDSSSTVLSFSYTVTDDDTDLDGISIDAFALKLNGGSIKREDTNVDAALTHTHVLADDDQLVNLPPLITGVEVTSTPQAADDTYGLGEDIEITVTFNEAVEVEGDIEFGISADGRKQARLKSGSGTTELVFAYTVQAGDEDDDGIWIGNHNTDHPTFALQPGQSVVGVDSGRPALLEHDEVGTQGGHKVDGINTDATLSSLTLSGITLDQTFTAGAAGTAVTSFTATTDAAPTTVTAILTATPTQSGASVAITPADADINTTDHEVDLDVGDTVITVAVTSSNGDVVRTYTITVTRPAGIGVPHDWDLRPPAIATGKTFRLLIVTSDRRTGQSGDVDDYNDHVQDAVASGHSAIQDHSSGFRALVGTKGGASPRDNTHSNKDSDGRGEQIWWLKGPKAADNYVDFYDGSWDHTNPVRLESGNSRTFYDVDDTDQQFNRRIIWTGSRYDGVRSGSRHLGSDGGQAYVGVPYFENGPLRYGSRRVDTYRSLSLYGLSPVFLVEAPDAPYATTAAITTDPANGTDYRTGEVVKATVTFSEDVTVTGTPQLPLQIGGEERDADYAAGDSSSTVLSFSYSVTDDDTDRDGISIDAFALKLNGGTIKRTDTNVDAALTHTRVLADDDHKVNLRPLITDIEVTSTPQATSANDTYGLGEDIEITVTFSEAVNVTGDVDFGLSVGGAKRARLKSGSGTTELVFAYTVQASDDDDNGIFIGNQDSTNATLALQTGQTVIGAVSGLRADLDHDEEGRKDGHKVDGSLTAADATLSSLTMSDITLVPAFAPGATAYTATTRLSSTTVTIAISQGQNGATGRITAPADADLNASGHQVNLAEDADTVITITVTSSNGYSMRTYTVTVTRQPAIEADATLSVLALSGGITLVPAFDPRTTAYAATTTATTTTVTATASQSGANMDIDPDDADTNTTDHDVNLAEGDTVITVTVISSNGDATRTYTVTVTREAANGNRSAPPPPKNVRAVEEKGGVRLTWQPPDGPAVTGYRIERRRAGGHDSDPQRSDGRPRDHHTLVEDTGSADTGYTDKSAEQGVEYEYRVTARNESGPGESSDWVRAGPEPASNNPATGAPTISGTTQVGQTLTAGISGIADADGLSGETFTYQWVSGDGTADTDIENATASTYTLVEADQGRSVKVRVTFTDGGGNEETLTSAPTGPVLGGGLPGAPRNLTATPGNREITLSWEPPADNGNAPATRYRIEWRIDGKDYEKNHWGTARSTTYTTNDQANLANGVKYFFRVKAENDDGNSYGPYGPASGEVSATPTSGSAVDLGTPVLSDTETLHHGMVRLDWQDVEDAGWYVVQYYHVEDGEWLDLPAEGVDIAFHGSSAVVSNVHGLSWLRVRAMSCAGESEWSQIEQLFGTNASDWDGVPVPEVEGGDEIEPCPVVLGTPVLSDTEALHHGMVQLDWQDIEDAGWYVVQYYHVNSGEWLDLPAEGVDIAFHGSSAVVSNVHGLSWLRVRAMSCAGESEWSQIEQLFGTNASDWDGVPVPEVAEGDETEPCSEDADTTDNSPATGAPTISGTAQVGETLTADTSGIADADGLGSVQYEYQWLADDADISGATNATYTLEEAEEGKGIKVRVSFTDDAGNEETLTSEVTAAVAAKANSPATGAPTISGTAQVGQTLTANTSGVVDADGLDDVSFTYQWLADDAAIAGATGSTYTLADADEGNAIKVRVSFIDDAGNDETLTSAATDAVAAAPAANTPATGAPTIGGTTQVGETLTADTSGIADEDGLENVTFSYQWLAGDTAIQGAIGSSYTLQTADEGKTVKVQVSFTDDAGNEETLTSGATDAVAAAPASNSPATGAPAITGTAQVGETLTADTTGIADADGLENVSFSYQWLADDAEIAGATGLTYTLSAADEGKAVKVQVSFTDDAGNEETLTSGATDAVAAAPASNSPATGAPTISGTAQVGETLTADTSGIADADGLSNVQYEYQWLADDAEISGATNATYTLEDADEGKAIKVQVGFTDDVGNNETLTSAATDAVAARPNSLATGAPTITGTAQVGQTLTADTSGIADADGLADATFSYQWLADDTDIAGATGLTYTLTDSEESKAITVQVSFTDDAGHNETLTSAATAAVAGAQPTEPPAKPRNLEATATHDSVTLTWDDPGDNTITGYVILRRVRVNDTGGDFSELVADTGTAATTYTDNNVEAGTTYTYRIKAINGAGTSERSRWFHIDTPAAPVPDKPTGLEATATHGQVVLTWDDPGDDTITGYVILRRVRVNDTGGDFSVLVADTSSATTYTDATVAAGATYTYRIKAINEHGTSERSRWFHIDILEAP